MAEASRECRATTGMVVLAVGLLVTRRRSGHALHCLSPLSHLGTASHILTPPTADYPPTRHHLDSTYATIPYPVHP